MRICPFCKIVAEARLAAAVTEPMTEKSFILKVSSSLRELKKEVELGELPLSHGELPTLSQPAHSISMTTEKNPLHRPVHLGGPI